MPISFSSALKTGIGNFLCCITINSVFLFVFHYLVSSFFCIIICILWENCFISPHILQNLYTIIYGLTANIGSLALTDSKNVSRCDGVTPTICKNDNPKSSITAPTPYHKYLVGIISLVIDFHEFLSLLVEVAFAYFDLLSFSSPCRYERLSAKACYSKDIVP